MVVVLPVPLTPTTRMTSGSPSTFCTGRLFGGVEDGQQLVLQHALQFVDVANLLAIDLLAQGLQHGGGGGGAQVGGDQRGFQIVERVAVDLLAESTTTSSMRSLRLSRVRVTASFMRSQETRFFFGAAKQGLNH